MLRRALIALLITGLAGCGGAGRVGGSPTGVRVLTMLNSATDPHELTGFAGEVARLSHGSLRIRIVSSSHAGATDAEVATIRDVRMGRGDLAWAAPRAWDAVGVRTLRALAAPMLIDSYALQDRVLRSDLASRLLDDLRPLGLVGLGILPGPMRKPMGTSHRLVSAADFRGLAIGTQGSRVSDATLRALGARPVRQPAHPTLAHLTGLEMQLSAIAAWRLDVPGSHLAGNVDLWPRPLVLYANAHAFERLTSGQRQILRSAAADQAGAAGGLARSDERESVGDLCRRGAVTFDTASPGELRALRAAVQPVYAELEQDPSTRSAIAAISRLKQQLAAPPDGLARCPRQAAAAAPARTALDGAWRMDTQRSAAGLEGYAENWGHWIFVFDRGRFAITQQNRMSCTWGYGTYTVSGRQTTWRFTDGGGEAPDGAQNKPGEQFSFGLSSYRDTLTLTPVKGQISPVNFRVKSWRRLASTPSRSRLSSRCPPPASALSR